MNVNGYINHQHFAINFTAFSHVDVSSNSLLICQGMTSRNIYFFSHYACGVWAEVDRKDVLVYYWIIKNLPAKMELKTMRSSDAAKDVCA